MAEGTESKLKVERHSNGSTGALILIFVGAIFLLNNFGILEWSIWSDLWKFWPLILIIIGLNLLLGSSRLGSFIVFLFSLLLIGAVLLGAFLGFPNNRWFNEGSSKQITTTNSDYTLAEHRILNVNAGIGKVIIKDNESNLFFEAKGPEELLESKISQSSDEKTVTVTMAPKEGNFHWYEATAPEYSVTLGRPALPTTLSLENGVGKTELHLKYLKTNRINLKTGTGALNVNLEAGSIPTEELSFKVGTGSAILTIPKEIGLKIEHEIGLGSVKIDSQNLRGDNFYATSNYETAALKLLIKVDVGTGSVTINR